MIIVNFVTKGQWDKRLLERKNPVHSFFPEVHARANVMSFTWIHWVDPTCPSPDIGQDKIQHVRGAFPS